MLEPFQSGWLWEISVGYHPPSPLLSLVRSLTTVYHTHLTLWLTYSSTYIYKVSQRSDDRAGAAPTARILTRIREELWT